MSFGVLWFAGALFGSCPMLPEEDRLRCTNAVESICSFQRSNCSGVQPAAVNYSYPSDYAQCRDWSGWSFLSVVDSSPSAAQNRIRQWMHAGTAGSVNPEGKLLYIDAETTRLNSRQLMTTLCPNSTCGAGMHPLLEWMEIANSNSTFESNAFCVNGTILSARDKCLRVGNMVKFTNATFPEIQERAISGLMVGVESRCDIGLLDISGARIGEVMDGFFSNDNPHLTKNISLESAHIGMISGSALGQRSIPGHLYMDYVSIDVMNISQSCGNASDRYIESARRGLAVGLDIDGSLHMSFLRLGERINQFPPCWLSQATIFGNLYLNGLVPQNTTFHIPQRAFFGLDVGNFYFENTSFVTILLEASAFQGLSVAGNFSLRGTRFRENKLPSRLFNGLVMNRQEDGYAIDLSYCGLVSLETKGQCSTTCVGDSGGPFSGIVTSIGNVNQFLDLSHNSLTSINVATFNGIGVSNLSLAHNNIHVWADYWFVNVHSVLSLNSTSNPSHCSFNASGDAALLRTVERVKCSCAPGFSGNGNFCSNASCNVDALARLSLSKEDLDAYGTFPPGGVRSGMPAPFSCPNGFNVIGKPAQCAGGMFLDATASCHQIAPDSLLSTAWTIGLVFITLLLITGIMGLLWRHRVTRTRYKADLAFRKLLLDEKTTVLDELEGSWKIPIEQIQRGPSIGVGAYGTVYSARWESTEVALKVLHSRSGFDIESNEVHQEAAFMSTLRHPHIVTFFGAGIDSLGHSFIVSEYMTRGSLRTILDDEYDTLSWSRKINFVRDIGSGMRFLHTREPPLMHRDLKSDNCLVNDQWVAKVSDFGTVLRPKPEGNDQLSPATSPLESAGGILHGIRGKRRKDSAGEIQMDTMKPTRFEMPSDFRITATAVAGTPLYMAPEVLDGRHGTAKYGLASDVYSFGMVMFEVLTGTPPFAHLQFKNQLELTTQVLGGMRPRVPTTVVEAPWEYVTMMRRCWLAAPNERPSFTALCKAMSDMSPNVLYGLHQRPITPQ